MKTNEWINIDELSDYEGSLSEFVDKLQVILKDNPNATIKFDAGYNNVILLIRDESNDVK